ncbi:MAG: helix-turn-helix domain-containing protein [Actinomycetota bacterium]
MDLTTRESAERLGVNQSRVRALIASGGLNARRVGGRWLINADSVDRQVALTSARATGRSMAQRIAWATAHFADGGNASWLATNERARLRQRLSIAATSPEIMQRWLRARADSVSRYRVGESDLSTLLATEGVVGTGVSATEAHRLSLGGGNSGDAYVTPEVAQRLINEFFLIPSQTGNLILRVVRESWHQETSCQVGNHSVAARLITGVDLADDIDVRSKSAGRSLINTALDEKKWE